MTSHFKKRSNLKSFFASPITKFSEYWNSRFSKRSQGVLNFRRNNFINFSFYKIIFCHFFELFREHLLSNISNSSLKFSKSHFFLRQLPENTKFPLPSNKFYSGSCRGFIYVNFSHNSMILVSSISLVCTCKIVIYH